MAKKQVLTFALWVLSIPQLTLSKWAECIRPWTYEIDLEKCLSCVDRYHDAVPLVLIKALSDAEDHRSFYHPGVDPIGMMRSIWVWFTAGKVQGASTIEQQFVRVVTGRYERTLTRKVREQLLAVSLARYRGKKSIASAYLAVAFYGSGCIGLNGLYSRFGCQLGSISHEQALRFVCQLKYPRPLRPSAYWHARINERTDAIWMRIERAANKSLQGTFDPRSISQPQNTRRLKRP